MPENPIRPERRPLVYLGVGIALAGLLAAVLFAGVGTGHGSAAGTAPGPGSGAVASAEVAPGVNRSTAALLSLTVLREQQPVPPGFTLTDQYGHPISPAMFRGKTVVIAGNDDRCVDLCTFFAADVVAANHDLGRAARNVVWLSINVNPFYPQVRYVRSFTDEHGLAHQRNWYFGTASPAALEKVWQRYGFYVQLDHRNRTVVHSAELFFVSPSGHERYVAEFGAPAANTALFAHGMAQVANDLLPASERVHVGGPATPASTAGGATVGAPAPPIALRYLQGGQGTFRLSRFRGHYSVVDFFSSTCVVCRTEMPALERAYRFSRPKVDFVGVDVADRPGAARALLARTGVTYPVVSDPTGSTAGAARITGLPFTLLVSPSGRVLIRHPGGFTAEQLDFLLEGEVPSLGTGP